MPAISAYPQPFSVNDLRQPESGIATSARRLLSALWRLPSEPDAQMSDGVAGLCSIMATGGEAQLDGHNIQVRFAWDRDELHIDGRRWALVIHRSDLDDGEDWGFADVLVGNCRVALSAPSADAEKHFIKWADGWSRILVLHVAENSDV
ncbi:MAG: hypothetical protein ACXW36_02005 [Nitrospira sp.]